MDKASERILNVNAAKKILTNAETQVRVRASH